MRLLPPAATLLTAAALSAGLAACSPGSAAAPAAGRTAAAPARSSADPDAGLLTGAQLEELLEPASYFPSGFSRDRAGTRDTGPSYRPPRTIRVRKPKCRLLGGTSWTSITGIDGVSFAQDDYIDKASSAEIAQEIDVYRGTTAQTVMRKLGAISSACPSYSDSQTGTQASVREHASAPLGEGGGYVITVTDPAWSNGTTLVAARVGTAVVTVLSTDGADNGHTSAMRLTAHLVAALRGRA
jgi:hypothetical protein